MLHWLGMLEQGDDWRPAAAAGGRQACVQVVAKCVEPVARAGRVLYWICRRFGTNSTCRAALANAGGVPDQPAPLQRLAGWHCWIFHNVEQQWRRCKRELRTTFARGSGGTATALPLPLPLARAS